MIWVKGNVLDVTVVNRIIESHFPDVATIDKPTVEPVSTNVSQVIVEEVKQSVEEAAVDPFGFDYGDEDGDDLPVLSNSAPQSATLSASSSLPVLPTLSNPGSSTTTDFPSISSPSTSALPALTRVPIDSSVNSLLGLISNPQASLTPTLNTMPSPTVAANGTWGSFSQESNGTPLTVTIAQLPPGPNCAFAVPDETVPHHCMKLLSRTLFVGGFPIGTSLDKLQELFASEGRVEQMMMNQGRYNAFVKVATRHEAELIKERFKGFKLDGGTLKVKKQGNCILSNKF